MAEDDNGRFLSVCVCFCILRPEASLRGRIFYWEADAMNEKTRKLTLTAMLGAMAYLIMLVGRVPIVMFLKYDPKDAVIAIGGFLLGPMSAALMSVTVSLIEMFSVSDTGWIGFFMNVLSTCTFVLPAAYLYSRKRTLASAVTGLCAGIVCMAASMMAWNYIVTPLFMNVPREFVASKLLPVFLPFNLFKGVLNAGLTLLIYKPVSRALRRAHLMPAEHAASSAARNSKLPVIISLFVIATAVLCFYLLHKG